MSTDPLVVRALVACYPRRWRDRYGDEYAALLSDTFDPARWHRRPVIVLNTLRGAWDARVHPYGGVRMSPRSPMSMAIWATGLFTVAGIGFQKLTEDTAFAALRRVHSAIGTTFTAMVVASIAAIAAIVVVALPSAIAMVRGGYAGAWKLIAVPPIAFAAWYGILRLCKLLGRGHGVHSAANITAAVIVVAAGIGVVVATAWSASAVLRRVDASGPSSLRPVMLAVLAGGMGVTTLAALAWGLAIRSANPPGFAAHDGILATPFVPGWIVIVALMATATVLAAAASRQIRRPVAAAA